uniref:uncharacterized protein LOC120332872 n=1 Tax=Styela clava TaxID=7725 RepID=UPI001939DE1F|nr:uncharacterized protein LOC120332872 [Styela clava]
MQLILPAVRFFLLLLWFSSHVYCQKNRNKLMCEPIVDDFSLETQTQGSPGKRGAAGPKGDKGENGIRGVVDYTVMNLRINQAIVDMNVKFQEEITQYKKQIENSETNTRIVNLLKKDLCPIFHNEKCFFLITDESRMDLTQSREKCQSLDGQPANIYDREHFEKIVPLLRVKIFIGYKYTHIWTGMTVDAKTRKAYLTSNREAPYSRWFPERPYSVARPHVGIQIDAKPSSHYQGIFDENPSSKHLGVLCEIQV